MKKVALVIYSTPFHYPPTINAANLLSEMGMEVHLLGVEYSDDWSQQLNSNVKLVYFGKQQTGIKGIMQYGKSILFLYRYVKQNSISSLLGYDAKSVLPAFIVSRLCSVKWFFHQHDFWEKPRSIWEKFLWKTERWLLKYARHTSFPQTERAEFFKSAADLRHIPSVVFNGPRKQWIEKEARPDKVITNLRKEFDYILIYQGGWSSFFGLERIFNALSLCKTHTALVMLGEEREAGIRQQYLTHIQRLGLQQRVYLAEKYIPYESLPGFTRFCDAAIAILTSEHDDAPFNNRYLIGASNKITEYIACGLPVMIQDSAPNRRFMQQYPVGILVDSNNAQSFAAAIDTLLTDAAGRKDIALHNRQLFLEELNFDRQFSKITSLF